MDGLAYTHFLHISLPRILCIRCYEDRRIQAKGRLRVGQEEYPV